MAIKLYTYAVILLMVIMPIVSVAVELIIMHEALSVDLLSAWCIFWALGVRLFTAGIFQLFKPLLTSNIVGITKDANNNSIIKELGCANVSIGLAGIVSLFMPSWRLVVACIGGLFMGLCGLLHYMRKPATCNGRVALVSDIALFFVVVMFMTYTITKNIFSTTKNRISHSYLVSKQAPEYA